MEKHKREKRESRYMANTEIALNVSYFCQEKGFNYADLIAITGIPQHLFYGVIYETIYSMEMLEKIASTLEVTTDELLRSWTSRKIEKKKEYVSSNIRVLCMIQGMSIQDVAERAGITRETLRKAVNGKYCQSTSSLRKIAEAFGIEKQELLYHDFREGRKEKLGENLKKLREARNLNISELSNISYVGARTIRKIEKTGELLKLDLVILLAEALDVSAEELLFGDF